MARVGLGLAAGLAAGLNTGYGMARDAYQDEQTQKRQAVEDVYKARADERTEQANQRENQRLDLMRSTEQRQQQRLDENERQQRLTQTTGLLEKSNADILARSRARTGAGMPVDPGDAAEFGRNQAALQRIRQDALNFFSRVQAGTEDIDRVSPGDLYMNFTAATGMKPDKLAEMPKHINDIQAGLQTGNQGLVVQATNGLMAPQLRRGVGAESPYGGTIVRKEIIGLDPAIDANGKEHPNRFIPRLRVYVDHPNAPGPKMDNGATGYYDAPMTKNGSADPSDTVVAIDIAKAMDYMGNMGVLANAVTNPAVAEAVQHSLRNLFRCLGTNDLMSEGDILKCFSDNLHEDLKAEKHNADFTDKAKRWLRISKEVGVNPMGEWGLAKSPHVKLRGIRDYAFLVLRRGGKPLHFTEVAKAITETFKRRANAATTHNELIKDKRFVLVGRGIYGLSEWGYTPGIVREVIRGVLAKKGPMTKEEVMECVAIINKSLQILV